MDSDKITFETDTIFSILGNNENKDYLVYYIISKFYNLEYKLATVMGNFYPYIRYISDNIYTRYDNVVFKEYLKNLDKIYIKYQKSHSYFEGDMEKNLLVIDTNYLNLNTDEWLWFLENHKKYRTTIIFILDKIKIPNIELLKKYTDYAYILKPSSPTGINNRNYTTYINNFVKSCYDTFGKSIKYETFIELYNRTVNENNMLFVLNKNEIPDKSFYTQAFYKEIKEYYFKTSKMYNDIDKYNKICTIRDILNISDT